MVIILKVLEKNRFSHVVATGEDSLYKSPQISTLK